jgi:AcrR family transcriptional regulator
MKPITDLRARRTRQWLQEALIALMQEKPFREIQITEIVARANVSRPAFYLHFHSKEALLLSHVDVVFEAFRAELAREVAAGRVDRERFSIMLFEYWDRYAGTLKLVIQADGQQLLLDRVRQYVGMLMDDLAAARPNAPARTARRALAADFMAGGAYMLLKNWVMNDRTQSAAEMGALLYRLTRACEDTLGA